MQGWGCGTCALLSQISLSSAAFAQRLCESPTALGSSVGMGHGASAAIGTDAWHRRIHRHLQTPVHGPQQRRTSLLPVDGHTGRFGRVVVGPTGALLWACLGPFPLAPWSAVPRSLHVYTSSACRATHCTRTAHRNLQICLVHIVQATDLFGDFVHQCSSIGDDTVLVTGLGTRRWWMDRNMDNAMRDAWPAAYASCQNGGTMTRHSGNRTEGGYQGRHLHRTRTSDRPGCQTKGDKMQTANMTPAATATTATTADHDKHHNNRSKAGSSGGGSDHDNNGQNQHQPQQCIRLMPQAVVRRA